MQRKTFGESGSSDLSHSLSHFRHAVRRVANTLNPSVVVQSTEVDDLAGSGGIHSGDNPPSGQTQTTPIRAESSAKRKLHKISLLSRFRSRPSDGSADDILASAVKTNCNGPQDHDKSNGDPAPGTAGPNDDVSATVANQYGPCCCGPGCNAQNGSAAEPSAGDGHAQSPEMDGVRVYKKTSTNGKLTLYVINRDLVITKDNITPLHGVVTVDREELANKKIFAQILLTFRYGRDDEEVMGLKLSNESVLCVEQVYPPPSATDQPTIQPSQCQEILLRRLGSDSHLVTLRLTSVAPPSVRLLPAKEYRGAAIGISYDLRVYTVENMDERPARRNQVRMALRLVQYAPPELQRASAPRLTLEKHFLLREGTVRLDVALDRKWYQHGMPLNVSIKVHNGSSRIVRKIRITTIQHVDVSMFSNGKFKNVVATCEDADGLPLSGGSSLERQYHVSLENENGTARHWVALEDRYGRFTNTLASTTLKSSPTERNFFAIYVTYYVKVRLIINGVGGDVSVKVPFILMRDGPEPSEGEVEQPANNKPAVEQCAESTNAEPSEITEPSESAETSEQAENLDNSEPHEDTTTPVPGDLQNPFAVANGSPDSSECSSPIDPMMEHQLDIEEKTDQENKILREDLP